MIRFRMLLLIVFSVGFGACGVDEYEFLECFDDCFSKECYEGNVWCYDDCENRDHQFQECLYGCEYGECREPFCSSHASRDCYNGNVYWYDSCGNREGVDEYCDADETCSNGSCSGPICTTHFRTECYGQDLYYYNSCGDREDIADVCGSGEICSDGECVPEGCSVTDTCSSKKCYQDDVWCYDNCGDRDHKSASCSIGCSSSKCLQCESGDLKCEGDNLKSCSNGFWMSKSCVSVVSDDGCYSRCDYSSDEGSDVCYFRSVNTSWCLDSTYRNTCYGSPGNFSITKSACWESCLLWRPGTMNYDTRCSSGHCQWKNDSGKWSNCEG